MSNEETTIRPIARLVESTAFNAFILISIVVAAVLIGVQTSRTLDESTRSLIAAIDWTIIIIFTLEALLKMLAHGRRFLRYFRDPWNVFDFLIVVVCYLPAVGPFAAVARLARILRAFRLISILPRLQMLVGAVLRSLPSMVYVGILLSVLFYIYAIIGTYIWRDVSPEHFGSLGESMMTLFAVVTLEGWTDVLRSVEDADATISGLALGDGFAALYFISFILLGTMIMLNLFIGVIVRSMEEVEAEEQRKARLRHVAETGQTTLIDDLNALDDQLDSLKQSVKALELRIQDERKVRE